MFFPLIFLCVFWRAALAVPLPAPVPVNAAKLLAASSSLVAASFPKATAGRFSSVEGGFVGAMAREVGGLGSFNAAARIEGRNVVMGGTRYFASTTGGLDGSFEGMSMNPKAAGDKGWRRPATGILADDVTYVDPFFKSRTGTGWKEMFQSKDTNADSRSASAAASWTNYKRQSSKEIQKMQNEQKQIQMHRDKLDRQALAKHQIGKISTKTSGLPRTIRTAQGTTINLQYTQAFMAKHIGGPDRGPHSGMYNTILTNPNQVVLGSPYLLLDQKTGNIRKGKAAIDIPLSLYKDLKLRVPADLEIEYERVGVPSKNSVSVNSFLRTSTLQIDSPKSWSLDRSAPTSSLIDLEGFIIPSSERKEWILIVDHMHRVGF